MVKHRGCLAGGLHRFFAICEGWLGGSHWRRLTFNRSTRDLRLPSPRFSAARRRKSAFPTLLAIQKTCTATRSRRPTITALSQSLSSFLWSRIYVRMATCRRQRNSRLHFITTRRPYISTMVNLAATYRVEIQRRAKPPKPWKWEIYRQGQRRLVKRSGMSYASRRHAEHDGDRALERIRRG